MDVGCGRKKGVRADYVVFGWAAGSRELPFTVRGKTAGGVRLWRKNQQVDIEHVKMKMS